MGLISKLLRKIFGYDQQKAEPGVSPNQDFINRWEKEQEERLIALEKQVKEPLTVFLKEKGSLPFSWESGNDEAFVTFRDKTAMNEDIFEDLEEYIVVKLNIPDAGEFQMNGDGTIYMDNNSVRAKYSSTIKAIIDFNEETEEEVFSEEEQDSGDMVLFAT